MFDDIGRKAGLPEDSLLPVWIIGHVVVKPLTHDNATQGFWPGVAHRVGKAAFPVAYEVTRPDLVGLCTKNDGPGSRQDIGTFVLVVMNVEFRAFIARCDLDYVKAQPRQPGQIPQ